MSSQLIPSITKFINNLARLTPEKFNGVLVLQNSLGQEWQLYFDKGRLIWTTGGVHLWRRWRRNIRLFCPQLVSSDWQFDVDSVEFSWQYFALLVLSQRNVISEEVAINIINNTLLEVLFDLVQAEYFDPLKVEATPLELTGELQKPLVEMSLYTALAQIKPSWEAWCQAGLLDYSPNLTPVMSKRKVLQEKLSTSNYERMCLLFDQQYSLRDLAVNLQDDLLKFTTSILPYLQDKSITLVSIDDISVEQVINYEENSCFQTVQQPPESCIIPEDTTPQRIPLIACVDDYPLIHRTMKKIINRLGYNFIGIQESMLALPQLIEVQPDLIFLDLDMPVVNGYELCSQIRRVPSLKDTPIVILTGRDGVIDKMRTQFGGASEFINKPISLEKIIEVLDKYLLFDNSVNDHPSSLRSLGDPRLSGGINGG